MMTKNQEFDEDFIRNLLLDIQKAIKAAQSKLDYAISSGSLIDLEEWHNVIEKLFSQYRFVQNGEIEPSLDTIPQKPLRKRSNKGFNDYM